MAARLFPVEFGGDGIITSLGSWDERRSIGSISGRDGGNFGFDVGVLFLIRALMLLASHVMGENRGRVIGNTLLCSASVVGRGSELLPPLI